MGTRCEKNSHYWTSTHQLHQKFVLVISSKQMPTKLTAHPATYRTPSQRHELKKHPWGGLIYLKNEENMFMATNIPLCEGINEMTRIAYSARINLPTFAHFKAKLHSVERQRAFCVAGNFFSVVVEISGCSVRTLYLLLLTFSMTTLNHQDLWELCTMLICNNVYSHIGFLLILPLHLLNFAR